MGSTWMCERCGYVDSTLNSVCSQCNINRNSRRYSSSLASLSPPNSLIIETLYDRDVPDHSEYAYQQQHSLSSYTNGHKFEDLQFPASNRSLGQSDKLTRLLHFNYPSRNSWTVYRWLRPEKINWQGISKQWPITVFNNPRPGDIIQGKLGDCWLIAALSLVSEVPSILFKIMVTKEYNALGMYQIRLCDRGLWKVFTIDDRFPVANYDFFVFTYAKRRQLFAALIEKAFAKMHGNYSALKSGRCDEGLQSLTGEPTEVLFLRSSSGRIKRDYDNIWNRMVLARKRGYIMTCPASNPKLNNRIFDKRGIESNHAYSIMDVVLDNDGKSRYVILRNPWGNRRRDNNFIEVQPTDLLTMHFEEMPYYFSSVSICKFNPHWTEVRKRGQFGSFSSPLIESVYMLEIIQPMQLEIELFNAGDGMYYNRKHDPDVDLCLIVMTHPGQQTIGYYHDVDFYVSFSSDHINPGIYQVLALSFATIHHKVYPIYNIVFHGSKHFIVHNNKIPNMTLAEIFHSVALSQNRIHSLSKEASILTFNDNGNFGMVVENLYSQAIKVHSDFSGTKNVLSSRGSSLCIDVIPPLSRALITLFTRRVYKGNVLISYKSKAQRVNLPEAHQPRLNKDIYPLHHSISLC
ncbi:hypothetical protein GJ496_005122 [Pomphorhynchus laevis]|nr:hypothetical protein GJ496_005122 [Pomphorhynchus laevis]